VVLEGFCHSLAEEKDSLEHVHSGLMDSCLEESRFPLRVTCIFSIVVVVVIDGQFVGVNTPLMPRLATGFQGFKPSARHQPFLQALRADPCKDTLLPLQGVKSGQRSNNVSRQPVDCPSGCCESMVMQLIVAG
jgi:hypothetical protein